MGAPTFFTAYPVPSTTAERVYPEVSRGLPEDKTLGTRDLFDRFARQGMGIESSSIAAGRINRSSGTPSAARTESDIIGNPVYPRVWQYPGSYQYNPPLLEVDDRIKVMQEAKSFLDYYEPEDEEDDGIDRGPHVVEGVSSVTPPFEGVSEMPYHFPYTDGSYGTVYYTVGLWEFGSGDVFSGLTVDEWPVESPGETDEYGYRILCAVHICHSIGASSGELRDAGAVVGGWGSTYTCALLTFRDIWHGLENWIRAGVGGRYYYVPIGYVYAKRETVRDRTFTGGEWVAGENVVDRVVSIKWPYTGQMLSMGNTYDPSSVDLVIGDGGMVW